MMTRRCLFGLAGGAWIAAAARAAGAQANTATVTLIIEGMT